VFAVLFAALAAESGQSDLAQQLEQASSAADRNRILDAAPAGELNAGLLATLGKEIEKASNAHDCALTMRVAEAEIAVAERTGNRVKLAKGYDDLALGLLRST
jgi:hypothetical protein